MSKENQIIFIDDEQDILNSLERLFFDSPYGVMTTTDPETALQWIDKYPIKVVVSDYRMPKMNGVELLKKVKDKRPECVRIIFTGYADLTAAEEAINISGVYRFLSKPWDGEELKLTMEQAIQRFDMQNENNKLLQLTRQKNEELTDINKKLEMMFEKQKSFTSTVSHELRTPLASIKTAIDIVMSGTAGNVSAQQKDFLGKAKDNVDRLNRLINDVLDLSKMESGMVELEIGEHDIIQVIGAVCFNHANVAKEKGLEFIKSVPEGKFKFSFDKDKICQVLDNLLSNAIKFTENGHIKIGLKADPGWGVVHFKVSDTGPGIDKEDFDKLFKKFQQLGDPEKRKTGGTGLGLAICKEIINSHGGEIWVESKPGKGTSFCFSLPTVQNTEGKNEKNVVAH